MSKILNPLTKVFAKIENCTQPLVSKEMILELKKNFRKRLKNILKVTDATQVTLLLIQISKMPFKVVFKNK